MIGYVDILAILLRSTDLGSTWDTLARSVIHFGNICIMKNGRIFVWSQVAGMLNDGFLYSSTDSGRTWNPLGSQLYMSGSNGQIYNEDECSFSLTYGSDPPPPLYMISVFYNGSTDSMYFAGGGDVRGALYDDGTSFVIPWVSVLAKVSTDPYDSTYVIQSGGNGLRISMISTIDRKYTWIFSDSGRVFQRVDMLTGIEPRPLLIFQFKLQQNCPNPFNTTTTIRYALPEGRHATLCVFKTLGQQLATLVSGQQEAGDHEVKSNVIGLASGIYFYTIRAGSFVQTRRFLLLR